MKILVVDDDQINNKMLSRKLEKRGFTIVQAFCGKECLEKVETENVDLILLDIMMPDLSGTEVLRDLRKRFTAFELPIIMVTGKGDTIDIVENFKDGANDYIVKPVNLEVALARINTQLELKSLHGQKLKKAELETAHAMIVTYNHEINNPLTIALGLLRKLETPENKDYTAKMSDALYRVVDIVKKIDAVAHSNEIVSTEYTDSDKMIKLK